MGQSVGGLGNLSICKVAEPISRSAKPSSPASISKGSDVVGTRKGATKPMPRLSSTGVGSMPT